MRLFMAKKLTSKLFIKKAEDLVTPQEQTRAGFIKLALEKNYLASPYIEEAKALHTLASKITKPADLISHSDLRIGLLSAAGLSDKSLNHLTEDDKTYAIKGLIEKFLEPAGDKFVDELVYRYLLTKGDALGGRARNLAGTLGERKFLRSMISVFALSGIQFQWKDNETYTWLSKSDNDSDIEKRIKGLFWNKDNKDRILLMNITVPVVRKNIDLSILHGNPEDLNNADKSIVHDNTKYLALGELKGGIDPAGADEHWKTANSALERIRNSFKRNKLDPKTFFIGAAIENSMASEMFKQLQNGKMDNAANLTSDEQLTSICEWIINL